MNLDNFVVRPRRRLVEKYAKPEAWTSHVAGQRSRSCRTKWPGCHRS